MRTPPRPWPPPVTPKRLLLFGTPLAGKSTIIAALGPVLQCTVGLFSREHSVIYAATGDAFTVVCSTTARFVEGQHEELLRWAERVLLVIDPQRSLEDSTRDWLASSRELWVPKLRGVQVTKGDLIARAPDQCFPLDSVLQRFGLPLVPLFVSSIGDNASLAAGVRHALEAGDHPR